VPLGKSIVRWARFVFSWMKGRDRAGFPLGTAFSWLYIPPLLYDTIARPFWLTCAWLLASSCDAARGEI
jgi:hypothetical protein